MREFSLCSETYVLGSVSREPSFMLMQVQRKRRQDQWRCQGFARHTVHTTWDVVDSSREQKDHATSTPSERSARPFADESRLGSQAWIRPVKGCGGLCGRHP